MKNLGIIIFLAFILSACNIQKKSDASSRIKAIKEQAETMGQLLLKKDYKAFAKYTHPKLIEKMGGEDKMIEQMVSGTEEMESKGIYIQKVTFNEPTNIISVGDELQCTLFETLEMKVPNGRLVTATTLIGISSDEGANWFFIDSQGKDIKTIKKSLPNLSPNLVIHEYNKPVFYHD